VDFDDQYRQTKVEFEEEWNRNTVQDLLETNHYKRAKEELGYYEEYLPKNDWILEAGCGLGPKVLFFREQGYRIVGVDFVFSALARLKKYEPETHLTSCDIHACPFPDNTFGAYLSYGVVEHFPHGCQDAVQEAFRVLMPGGIIVIMVPARNLLSRFIHDPDNLLQKLRRQSWVRKIVGKPLYQASEETELYMKLHGRREMREILQKAGFEILLEKPVSHSFSLYMLCECFHADSSGNTNFLADWMAWVLKKWVPWESANHLMFVAKK
jgi:ubiquinone/menaquinone biosynthesis C-methylase UbiE